MVENHQKISAISNSFSVMNDKVRSLIKNKRWVAYFKHIFMSTLVLSQYSIKSSLIKA